MSELTARQRQIVTLLAQGMSNKEIARMLSIGEVPSRFTCIRFLNASKSRHGRS